jgi:hypothetical protein
MYFYLSGIKLTWGSLYCDLLFVCTYLYDSGIALYLGFLVIFLQILRRILKKDLRRELRKVLL